MNESVYIEDDEITLMDENNREVTGKYLMTYKDDNTNKTYLFYKINGNDEVKIGELVNLEYLNTNLSNEELTMLKKVYNVLGVE